MSLSKTAFCLMLLMWLTSKIAFSQKEKNVWYFGDGFGLDFNNTPPTVLKSNNIKTVSDCASVSDSAGNFLFFTNGLVVLDKTQNIMPNGFGLKNNTSFQGSWTQTSISIVKKPGSKSLYYIFTVDVEYKSTNVFETCLYYHIVDMSLNYGKGDIVAKNIPLLVHDVSTEIVAVKDAKGCGFWIIAHRPNIGTYYSFHINSLGINTTPVTSVTGTVTKWILNTACKVSPDKQKIASLTNTSDTIRRTNIVELFDFDNLTGKLSNCRIIDSNKRLFGFSFSPNSKFLYFSTIGGNGVYIYQFDVSLPTASAIAASKFAIYVSLSTELRGMQLGPDNRIYIILEPYSITDQYLSVIQYPDNKGAACGFVQLGIFLGKISGGDAGHNLPNLIESVRPFTLDFELGLDTTLCTGQNFEIDGAKYIEGNFLWNTGDTSKVVTVNSPGLYKLSVSSLCGIYTDSIQVKVGKPFTVFLGNDTAFCGPFRHLLNAHKGAKNYLWNTGDTTVTLLVDKPNIYAVAVKDSNHCNTGDTVDIGQLNKPSIDLWQDTVTCQYVYLSITKPDSAIRFAWSTGDSTLAIKITKKGTYSVTFSNRFCSISSSIAVDKLPKPDLDLGPDTSICDGNPIILDAGSDGQRVWNTKDTSQKITVSKEGIYAVKVSRNNCNATDSIWVGPICDMWYYIPNAFTPGRDATNDVFGIEGGYVKHIDMRIFDRWGELVYYGSGLNPSWDGTYKNRPCADDVYGYMISVTGYKNGLLRTENNTGNVTLLR